MWSKTRHSLITTAHDAAFKIFSKNRLVYNACWEDPRIDRHLLNLNNKSKVLMITSGGCNVLDYLIDSPAEICTVDINWRQNALLHLKRALIERGDFEDLFQVFGMGSHRSFRELLRSLQSRLPCHAMEFWHKNAHYFQTNGFARSFYYRGIVGGAAWLLTGYLYRTKRELKTLIWDLLKAESLDEQEYVFSHIEPEIWNSITTWLLGQPLFLGLLGASAQQTKLIQMERRNGAASYIRAKLRHVMTEVPIKDNYFWRVYLTGSYTHRCCPNYLKQEHFPVLRANIKRISIYTTSIMEFLKHHNRIFTHFVLLDHQDWFGWNDPEGLKEEWRLLLKRSTTGTKILMRSASPNIDFLPGIAKSAVRFYPNRTANLHQRDRAGTYGSLHLGEVL